KVFFEIGKTTLNDMNEENLNYFAEQIKNSNSVYTIKGYADKTTGSKARNQKLANDRAKNVYDILIKKGVSEKNLKVADPGEIVAPNGRDAKFVRMVEIK
ncbi:MAG: OmpA family protein, partial [Bacteroidales bacterium]|nr:OmpA family protein [Bacteroidales bacterium]